MKGGTVQINWHDTKPVLSLDFHHLTGLLATAGADYDIKVNNYYFNLLNFALYYFMNFVLAICVSAFSLCCMSSIMLVMNFGFKYFKWLVGKCSYFLH